VDGDRVELYRVDLNPPAECVPGYRRCLSQAECDRVDRFVTDELTRRSLVCRAVLRKILSAALGVAPQDVQFQTGPHGKPALAADHASQVEFNVSHTDDVALVAVAARRALGVDVEALDRRVNRDELAARFFSPLECQAYFSLDENRRVASFYRIWTCKEAYLKAIGAGLSFPLGKFSVSASPEEPPGLIAVEGAPEEPSRWSFVAVDVGDQLAAALAVEGHGWTLERREWTHGVATGSS